MLTLLNDYLLGLAVVMALVLTRYAWGQRNVPGARPLLWLSLAVSVWALGYSFEITAGSLAAKLLWAKLEYIGIVATPPAWYTLALIYTQPNNPPRRQALARLLPIPLITLALVWTNQLHHLVWRSTELVPVGPNNLLMVRYGVWFGVHAAFSYLLLLLGTARLIIAAFSSPGLLRWQASALVLCVLAPWASNLVYLTHMGPTYPYDLTPFAFGLSTVVLGWSFLKLRLFDLAPVAHSTILRNIEDAVLVLDAHQRIVHANLAAAQIFGARERTIVSRSLAELLGPAHPLAQHNGEPGRSELSFGGQVYDLQIVPVQHRGGHPSERMLILHDITERKHREEAQHLLAEAAQLLTSAHDIEAALRDAGQLIIPRLADLCVIQLIEDNHSVRPIVLGVSDPAKQAVLEAIAQRYPLQPSDANEYTDSLYTGAPYLASEVPAAELAGAAHDAQHLALLQALDLSSLMQVPLLARGEVLGACLLARTGASRAYDTADLAIATELTHSIALAIDNARLLMNLQASEQRYRAVVSQAADSILLADAAGRVLDSNDQALARLGYTRAELRELSVYNLLSGFGGRQMPGGQVTALGGQALTAKRKDGSFFPAEASVGSFAERDQTLFVIILHDITERVQIEDQLRRHNEELLALHQTALGLIDRLDLARLLEAIVVRAATLLETPHGYLYVHDPEADELVVWAASGMFTPQIGYRIKRGQGLAGRVWTTGEPLTIENYREWPGRISSLDAMGLRALVNVPIRTRSAFIGVLGLAYQDGRRTPGQAEISLLERFSQLASLAIDNAQLYSAAQQELEERRRTEAALLQAEISLRQAKETAESATEAKSRFLAHMSHELRTPLSSVLGNTELLLTTELADEQREYAEMIRTSGGALLGLIDDVLDFSKIESGNVTIEHAPFTLRDCIEGALDMIAVQAAQKQLDVAYTLEPGVPGLLVGDSLRLRQILVNLLSNAVKFTQRGEIGLSVSAEPAGPQRTQLHFAVADTGIGIPPERIGRLFASFEQGDNSITRRYGGTGLGLAISKQLCELMGGQIWAESTVNAGSTFHVLITAGMLAGAEPPADDMLAGACLLVVEEGALTRQAIAEQAQAWGMQVSATGSALEALAWARQGRRFDVAVIGQYNADMSGLALIGQLRGYRASQALPIVLLAALGRQHDETAEALVWAVLRKPVKHSQLRTLLAAALTSTAGNTTQGAPSPAAPSPALNVLVVDDDFANQQLNQHLLQKLGHHASVAGSGQQALDMLSRAFYDVVLLDIQLGDMDGVGVARQIQQRCAGQGRPYIIAVTGGAAPALYAGGPIDNYLAKPLQLDQLNAALSRHLTPTPAPGPIDHELLKQTYQLIGAEQPGLMKTLIERFLEDTAALLGTIQAAAEQHDMPALRGGAHKLRSSSMIVAAVRLAERCASLERAAEAGAGYDALVSAVAEEFERVRTVLRHHLAG